MCGMLHTTTVISPQSLPKADMQQSVKSGETQLRICCLSWLQNYDVPILEAEPTCCFSACNCGAMHLFGHMSEHCFVAHSPSPFCSWSEWIAAALAQQLAHAGAWQTA